MCDAGWRLGRRSRDTPRHVPSAALRPPSPPSPASPLSGTLPQIECVAKAYVIALHATLSDGYVGTEECVWAIINAR